MGGEEVMGLEGKGRREERQGKRGVGRGKIKVSKKK